MRGRKKDSTNPNAAPTATPIHPTDELATEPQGPGDDRFVYHLTPKALALLAEHQGGGAEESDGPLARPVADTPAIRDAVQADTRRQRRRRRRREARRRGRRFATVHRVTRGARQLPLLRLSGQWLREAGFERGQEYEVEVGEGRLTLVAL